MPMRKKLALMILLAGCGGGDGGGVPFYGGIWRGDAIITSDPCNIAGPANLEPALSFVHTINQDGRKVVLDILGGATLSGTLDAGDDGFAVAIPAIPTAQNCLADLGIRYGKIDKGDQADVQYELVVKCGALACTVDYTGVSTRDH